METDGSDVQEAVAGFYTGAKNTTFRFSSAFRQSPFKKRFAGDGHRRADGLAFSITTISWNERNIHQAPFDAQESLPATISLSLLQLPETEISLAHDTHLINRQG